MKFYKSSLLWLTLIFLLMTSLLSAAMIEGEQGFSKKLDLDQYHNVGNIWLRVSNYGFFGSGSAITPPWPSLEYPGGSGIDYLFQGALWFGAKKIRKSESTGEKFYWKHWPPQDDDDYVLESDSSGHSGRVVLDTLVTVGFDGDKSLYEFLPAYNPLEYTTVDNFGLFNPEDKLITQSTRNGKRGVDDDGDGLIDEDPIGHNFPFRNADELPSEFEIFAGQFIHQVGSDGTTAIMSKPEIWFPQGFQDLSYIDPENKYLFTEEYDDDHDGLKDEDGAPVSEQDYISYYYDYSPFGSTGERDYGSSNTTNKHIPLNVRVRQMSYQWSYDYIKNLVYVEFNITNMNPRDTLYDCTMGIYMDADVGPQSYDSNARASEDKSGYVRGEGYEFAFTFDADFDGGLTPGYLGARVCTPNPDSLKFACWYWKVGDGPDDFKPQNYTNLGSRKTANEKYWLLTGENPNVSKFESLRKDEYEQPNDPLFIQSQALDTRFLFAFYGDQNGFDDPTSESWNLEPNKTMKIVIALFPGDTIDDLKASALWAKQIYGTSQSLENVVLPDTFPHYEPPEPPEFPRMYTELKEHQTNVISADIYWDNRSEYTVDYITVQNSTMGWNTRSTFSSDRTPYDAAGWPDDVNNPLYVPLKFRPIDVGGEGEINENATINPYQAWRLRHDFQGYSVWSRFGRGDSDGWVLRDKWDKIDTEIDHIDYFVNSNVSDPEYQYEDMGGDLGYDKGLANKVDFEITDDGKFLGTVINWDSQEIDYTGYYFLDVDYLPVEISAANLSIFNEINTKYGFYGKPLYNKKTHNEIIAEGGIHSVPTGSFLTDQQKAENQLKFKHPSISDEVFLALVDDALIPLNGHLGQNNKDESGVEFADSYQDRLCRRYYYTTLPNLSKGRELYISVTTFDRGLPSRELTSLESGKDANMQIFFPGPLARENMDDIFVVPNPYRGSSSFDGRKDKDEKGDKSRRLWFVNLPEKCNIQIYTLAGDLVDEFEHNGQAETEIITPSKAAEFGYAASGIHSWDILSKNEQIVASGLYFFSVKDHKTGDVKVGKFAIIR